ncbi:MAG: putative transposase YdaD, partial [Planctomycetota bacterium]
ELSRLFAHILDRPDTTIMSTLEHTFQKGKAEGQAEGQAAGQAAGQAEGQAKTILRMLELRFGAVAEDVRQTVLKGSTEQLDKWTDRVLAVSRPEDLVAD